MDELPYRYEKEMQANLGATLTNAMRSKQARQPGELYQQILEAYQDEDDVDDGQIWEFRKLSGGLDYLQGRVHQMSEPELELLLRIVYRERYSGQWSRRIRSVVEAYSRIHAELRREALRVVHEMARNEPLGSKTWQEANEFLVKRIEAGDLDSEAARQYWQRLGT